MQLSRLGMISLLFYSSLLAANPESSGAPSESYVYVPNRAGDSVTLCTTKADAVTKCHTASTQFKAPEGLALNPKGDLLYVVNNTTVGTVSMCQVNSESGALSQCTDAGGSDFYFPDAPAFNLDGSILYVVNAFGAAKGEPPSVTACLVDPDTGKLSNCVLNPSNTFVGPSWIQLNSKDNLAYISNFTGNTISVCHVDGQRVFNCNDTSGDNLALPDSITLNSTGKYAYITNNGAVEDSRTSGAVLKNKEKNDELSRNEKEISKAKDKLNKSNGPQVVSEGNGILICDVAAKSGLLSNCNMSTSSKFSGSGLAFDSSGSFAYISNFVENTVTVCKVNPSDGQLSKCHPQRYNKYNQPTGIALKAMG